MRTLPFGGQGLNVSDAAGRCHSVGGVGIGHEEFLRTHAPTPSIIHLTGAIRAKRPVRAGREEIAFDECLITLTVISAYIQSGNNSP